MNESTSITVYRDAVEDLMLEIAAHAHPSGLAKAKLVLVERIAAPEFRDVLASAPAGAEASQRALLDEVDRYTPNRRSSAGDLAALIRIYLLAQIDGVWWGHIAPFVADEDVRDASDLVDVDDLVVGFRYRRQASTFGARLVRAVERRVAPHRYPYTAGLRFTNARPEAVALADQLASAFASRAPAGTPPLWVTSMTRSVAHQQHLRALGYAAMLPSSHCTGYGMDIEMAWYRRYGAHRVLEQLVLERQQAGDISVIDEGQAWHVCISPAALGPLRRDFDVRVGG